jgi:hypothetical protein
MFLRGAWQRPITGLALGDATFIFKPTQSPFGNQSPLANSQSTLESIEAIGAGATFEWTLEWPSGSTLIGRGYIINTPDIYLNSQGLTEVKLELGDELALFSNSSRLAQNLYCGRPPKTAQEAAKIYAQTNGLFTRTYTPGHRLLDESLQTFTDESPHQFLQALYAPTNQDVRCSNSSRAIICAPRPPFNPTAATTLSYKQTLELDPVISASFEPFNSLKVYNNYDLVSENQRSTQVYREVSGQPTNTKPWFQGGYTETITTEITLGDTLIWSRSITSGYLPINPANSTSPSYPGGGPGYLGILVSKADYSEDPCDSQVIETEWGIINTKTFSLTYQEHPSGSYLINAAQNWERGLVLQQVTEDNLSDYSGATNTSNNPAAEGDYSIYNGIINYSNEIYGHTPQINSEVCSKDFIHLETQRRLDSYSLGSDFVYRLVGTEIDYYQASGQLSTLGQSSFIGTNQLWTKTEVRGAYDSDSATFITQPTLVLPENSPPTSKWVRPKLTPITAFTTVANPLISQNGRLFVDRPKPETAPFCYTQNQLTTYGNRILQQNNGLSRAREIVLPYFNTLALGDSVYYSDQNGQITSNLVFSIGVSQDGPLVTKSIVLAQYQ